MTASVVAADAEFESLVEEHRGRVAALARRIVGDPQLAEDIAQETFIRAYRHRGTLDPSRPAWPWLATITRRLCIDAQRRRRVQEVELDETAPTVATWGSAEDVFDARERQRSVAAAIGRLSPRQRRLLVLRDVEGWDYEEIAEFDTATVNALRCAVARARDAFREAYSSLERGMAAVFGLPLLRRLRVSGRGRGSASTASQLPLEAIAAVLVNLAVVGGLNGAPAPIVDQPPARPAAAVRHADVKAPAAVLVAPAGGRPIASDDAGETPPAPPLVAPAEPTRDGDREVAEVRGPVENPVNGNDEWGIRIRRTPEDDKSVTYQTADKGVDTTCAQADTALCHTGWLGSNRQEAGK